MLRDLLLYLLLPLWVLAGLADWWCHQHNRPEASRRGLRECFFHLTLLLQMAVGGLAALWLEINLGVLALMVGLFLAHEATHWMEWGRVARQRELRVGEQMLHSFMELLPVFAVLCLLALHGNLAGHWSEASAWELHWKRQPLPSAYVLGICIAIALLNAVPLLEASVRSLRGWPRVPARA